MSTAEFLWSDETIVGAGDETARPSITFYPAPEPNGSGVLVVPGGGYGHLAVGHEGADIAAWLNERGYDAWVLRYRVAPFGIKDGSLHPGPLRDALKAVELIHSTRRVSKLGVWGFSAGGHLTSTLITAADATGLLDFAVLCYPVITLEEPFLHRGSRNNLIGEDAVQAVVEELSSHYRVSANTPPTFIFHTGEDPGVPVENAILFYSALRQNKIPAELHIYESGPHGVGLAPNDPVLSTWAGRLEDWLKKRAG